MTDTPNWFKGLKSCRWQVGLIAFALAPLAICLICFGHRLWTPHWEEIPAVFGWSAPTYKWLFEGTYPPEDTSLTSLKPIQAAPRSGPDRAAYLHGLWLVLRQHWFSVGLDPLEPVLRPELSADARKLLAMHIQRDSFRQTFEPDLRIEPRDLFIELDWIAEQWRRGPSESVPNSEEGPATTAYQSKSQSPSPTGNPRVLELWRTLVEAQRVLYAHLGLQWRPSVWWQQMGAWGGASFRWPEHVGALLDHDGKRAYAEALEKLCQLAPEAYLESPFDERARQGWEAMGLEPMAARYLGSSDWSFSGNLAGGYCALHLETLETLAIQAISTRNLAEAADWLELQERVASLLTDSVRTPAVYNYLQGKYTAAAVRAQSVQLQFGWPAEVAERMAALVGRNSPAAARFVRSLFPYALPALYLDNVARGCLGITAVTLAVALVGAWHLRDRRWGAKLQRASAGRPAGTLLVAIVAVALVGALVTGLEASNYLGPRLATFGYALAGGLVLVVLVARVWWLVVSELLRGHDPQERAFRRRMAWLVGFLVLLAGVRFLLGGDAGRTSNIAGWIIFGLFGLLPSGLLVVFGVLRWRRWWKEPDDHPLLHPATLILAAAWLGLYLVFGPIGELLRAKSSAGVFEISEGSPVAEAGDTMGYLLGINTRGWNLLTATLAIRMTNLGVWLVIACGALWALVFARARWAAWFTGADFEGPYPNATRRHWLAATTWSCLWLGLLSFILYGWCTLGLCFCVNRIIAKF